MDTSWMPTAVKEKCTSKSKQSGERCRNYPHPGMEVCWIHGGKSLKGIASPTFKHGKHSVYANVLSQALSPHFDAVQETNTLMELGEDLTLHRALILQVLESGERGEAGELWVKLKEAWRDYQKAKKARLGEGHTSPEEALAMVGFLISEGYSEYMSRIELRQMLQERARLVEAEGKRVERAQASVRSDEVRMVIARVVESVRRNVPDTDARSAIQADLMALVGGGAG